MNELNRKPISVAHICARKGMQETTRWLADRRTDARDLIDVNHYDRGADDPRYKAAVGALQTYLDCIFVAMMKVELVAFANSADDVAEKMKGLK